MFTMIRGFATSGSNQLTNQVNQLKESVYSQYDQQTVYGSSVVTAINTYSSDKFSIVVNNNPTSSAVTQFSKPTAPASTGEDALKPYYYGYACSAGKMENSVGYFTASLDASADKSGSLAPIRASGKPGTYINESLRYDSYLIKDSTNTTIGIYFNLHID